MLLCKFSYLCFTHLSQEDVGHFSFAVVILWLTFLWIEGRRTLKCAWCETQKWRTVEDVSGEQKTCDCSRRNVRKSMKTNRRRKTKEEVVLRMMKMICIGKVEWLEPERNGCDMVRGNCRKTFSLLLLFTFHPHRTASLQFFLALQPFV